MHYPKIKIADGKWLLTLEKQHQITAKTAEAKTLQRRLGGSTEYLFRTLMAQAPLTDIRFGHAGLSLVLKPEGGPDEQRQTLLFTEEDEAIDALMLLLSMRGGLANAVHDEDQNRYELPLLRDDGQRVVAFSRELSGKKGKASIYFKAPGKQGRLFLSQGQMTQVIGLLAGIVAFNMDLPVADALKLIGRVGEAGD